jgi:hypothetical protein
VEEQDLRGGVAVALVRPDADERAQHGLEQRVGVGDGGGVLLAAGVVGSEYPVGVPLPGTYVARDGGVTIVSSTPTPPEGCEAPPTPTPSEEVVIPPPEPCRADSPLSWLGCNPWWLLLVLLLIGARLWWIGRNLQISMNGQRAIALRGGPKVGFNIKDGRVERSANPDRAQVKITRHFHLPGPRIDTSRLTGSTGSKPVRFRLGEELKLQDGAVARIKHGNPRPAVGPSGGASSAAGNSDRGVSSAL